MNGDTVGVLSGVPSVTSAATPTNPVGTYTIDAAVGSLSSANYSFSFVGGTLTITPASLLVSADDKVRAYGATNDALTVSYIGLANGEPPSVLSGSPDVSTLADTNSPVGTYDIQASIGTLSNANYSFSFTNGTLTVTQAVLTVKADDQNRPYAAANPTFTVSYSGFVNGEDPSILNGSPDVTTLADTTSPVGTYNITVAQGGLTVSDTNYALAFVKGTLLVTPLTLTVSVDSTARNYGDANPVFTGTVSGVQNGDSIVATCDTTATPASPVATYAIFPTLSGEALANYTITTNLGVLTINPAPLSVTAANASRPYGAANPPLTGTIVGIQNGDPIAAIYGTDASATSAPGTYSIVPSLSGPVGNYSVSVNNGTLTVSPASLLVSADDKVRAYGATNDALTVSYIGLANGEPPSVLSGSPDVSTLADTNSPVGTYDIQASIGTLSNANYSFSFTNGTLTVTQAVLTVKADDQNRPYAAANPTFTVSYSGFVNGEDPSILNGSPDVTTLADTTSPVGTYNITVAQGGLTVSDTNYALAFVKGTLLVTPLTLTVSVDSTARNYGDANPVFTGTVSGVQNGDSIVATCDTTATPASPVATYAIFPTLSGEALANYTITTNLGVLTINPAPLSVTAANASRPYGAANPPLTGTIVGIQNGDAITAGYSASTDTNTPVGTYAIVPMLSGPMSNYSVSINDGVLTVSPTPLLVSADNKSRGYGVTNPPLTVSYLGFVNGEQPAALSGSPDVSTLADTNSPVGTYDIQAGIGTLSNANYSFTFTNGTLTITPYTLVVSADSQTRTYGSANATLTGSISGLQNGDAISADFSTTTDATTPVGTYPIAITLTDSGNKLSNYSVTTNAGSITITQAALTVSADSQTRSYGSANAALTGSVSGLQNDDDISATFVTTADASSPVGTYTISASLSDLGAKLGNYSVTTNLGVLTVNPALLTGTADNKLRLYGQPNPLFTASYSGFVNGEDASLLSGPLAGGSSADTNSPVGTYAISVYGQSAPNYTIQYLPGMLTVAPASLVVTANDASHAYNQANPAFSASFNGFVNGQDVSALAGSLVFDTAPTNSPVGTYAIVPSGLLSTNYSLLFSNGTLTITPYTLVVSADSQTRSYGSANATLTGSVSGLQNGDAISADFSTTADATSAVGTYPIAITLTDSGNKLSNYSVTTNAGSITITQTTLTVSADSQTRTYGSANATLTGSISGLQNGDAISADFSTTTDATTPVGTYPIAITLTDSGNKLSNYSVTTNAGSITITQAALTVSADSQTRSYGSANAALTGSVSGLQNDDDISATFVTTADASSPVGTYTISASLSDLGAKLGNYSVTTNLGVLTVNPALLTGTADNKLRLYGQPNPLFTASYSGFVNGEDASLLSGPLAGGSSADTNSPVGTYAISVYGQSAPNYTIQYLPGMLTVAPASLVVTANDASHAYNQANPAFSASFNGFVNGQDVSALAGSLVFDTAPTNSPVGTYAIVPSGLLSTNYSLLFSNGTLTITPYTLVVSADSQTRSYGSANATLTGSVSGLQNGDAISADFSTTADATSAVGTYPIAITLTDSGNKLSNYSVTTNAGSITITQTTLTVSADSQTRTYGSANATLTGSISGLQNGDAISADFSTTTDATTPVGTYPIAITLTDSGNKLSNYSVTTNAGSITITQAALTVSADSQTRSYGSANAALTGSVSGLQNDDDISATFVTTADASSPVGTYTISASLSDLGAKLGNYSVTTNLGVLTVNPALLTGTADNKLRLYGQPNPLFTASYSGFVNGEDASLLSGPLAGGSSADTNSPVGTYAISVYGQSAPNYTIQYLPGMLTVAPASLVVTANDAIQVYGKANLAFQRRSAAL